MRTAEKISTLFFAPAVYLQVAISVAGMTDCAASGVLLLLDVTRVLVAKERREID